MTPVKKTNYYGLNQLGSKKDEKKVHIQKTKIKYIDRSHFKTILFVNYI